MRLMRFAASIIVLAVTVLGCALITTAVPVDHWGFAIAVNFLFMACFTLIYGVLHSPAYSSAYFEARPCERGGDLYLWIGAPLFRTLLHVTGWHRLTWGRRPIGGTLEALQDFEYRTKGSELVHLFAAICVAAVTIWIGWRHSLRDTVWLVSFNVLLNVYPVLLQRYHRPRVTCLIQRKLANLDARHGRAGAISDRILEARNPRSEG
jgi:hypothetical protein